MKNENEPTLTCSEVVERLATECLVFAYGDPKGCQFDRAQAEAILHEWRGEGKMMNEVRGSQVDACQRIERAVREIGYVNSLSCNVYQTDNEFVIAILVPGVGTYDIRLLKEWREQIRPCKSPSSSLVPSGAESVQPEKLNNAHKEKPHNCPVCEYVRRVEAKKSGAASPELLPTQLEKKNDF